MTPLNYDILLHIAEYLEAEDDKKTLFSFSVVNQSFNNVASKLLYHAVVLSPMATSSFRIGRHDQELVSPLRATRNAELTASTASIVDICMPTSQCSSCQ